MDVPCFPEDELMEWKAFDQAAIISTTDSEFGNDSVAKLMNKYTAFIPTWDDENVPQPFISECSDFTFLVAGKIKAGLVQNFYDVANYAQLDEQFGNTHGNFREVRTDIQTRSPHYSAPVAGWSNRKHDTCTESATNRSAMIPRERQTIKVYKEQRSPNVPFTRQNPSYNWLHTQLVAPCIRSLSEARSLLRSRSSAASLDADAAAILSRLDAGAA